MENAPYLSIIVPAYNEEGRIKKTLDRLEKYLGAQSFTWEIIIALDGPHDNTSQIVSLWMGGKSNVHMIDRKINMGKGHTVREGMLKAKGSIRLFTDADNSTDIEHFDKMKPLFGAGYDVIICSRDEKDIAGARQAVSQPLFKRLLGNMGNLFIQTVAVPGIWDTQCGFKACTAEAAQKIFSVAVIDRWGFDIEMLALARHFGMRVGIVPAHWINDEATHVTLMGYIHVLFETVQIRWNLITNAYDRKI